MHNNACMGFPWGLEQALCLTLTDLMGCLEVEVVDAVSVSCQQRGFLCCGGGDCNSYALDLAAALQTYHFDNAHVY